MASEIWKKLEHTKFLVSSKGRVMNSERGVLLNPWSSGRKGRYLKVTYEDKGKVVGDFVHRLVVKAFIGEIAKGLVCNHLDGNPRNNNISNLEVVSQSVNMIHAFRTGLAKKKLTSEQVIEIRILSRFSDMMNKDIAKIYNVPASHVSNIKRGKAWVHL